MTDDSIDSLAEALSRFAQERDWEQFHTPKNLAMALSVEAAELMEIFQWMTPEESGELSDRDMKKLKAELGDVFIYLVRLADRTGVGLFSAAYKKLEENKKKYPKDRVRG